MNFSGAKGIFSSAITALKNPVISNILWNVALPVALASNKPKELALSMAVVGMSPVKGAIVKGLLHIATGSLAAIPKVLDNQHHLELSVSVPFSQSGQSQHIAGNSLQYALRQSQLAHTGSSTGMEAMIYSQQYTNR